MTQSRKNITCLGRLRYGSAVSILIAATVCLAAMGPFAPAQASSRVVGTVKSVSRNSVVVSQQNGTDATVMFSDAVQIVRAAPGQTDLKTATPAQLSDIQVGDRIAAKVQVGDGNSLVGLSAILMKQSDIAEHQQHEREEWQRGIGGIVKEVDAANNNITLNNALLVQGKPIVVHIGPGAEIRRYAPNSINFDDSKPGTFEQIKPGDQLRARGTKNADGTEFTAQAIVSGSFRNIAGTVVSADAASNTVTITDLATRRPVTLKIVPDSQLHKLPQFVAMGIAMRLKGGVPGAAGAGGLGAGANAASGQSGVGSGPGRWQGGNGGQGGGRSANAAPGAPVVPGGAAGFRRPGGDFQQMLNRMPAVNISELNKGDAVILVATGESTPEPRVITLLTGVEPILTAAPAGTNAAATVLSPWNLAQGGAGAGGDAGPGQ